jgi:protein TonB
MTDPLPDPTPAPARLPNGRPRYRPPIGIPKRDDEKGWRGLVAALTVHAGILFLLILPALIGTALAVSQDSAGAKGPRGGGGGGRLGLMGGAESVRFIMPPKSATPAPTPAVVTPPPKPVPKAEVVPPPPAPPTASTPPAAPAPAAPAGGSGSGGDATNGNGPGVGGGAGAGVGTGTGNNAGPGTGGDGSDKYPPSVTNLAILPIPVPNGVRPYKMIATFDVDEKGTAKLIGFNPSRDGGYNRRIREMLSEIRFRPATLKNGQAVRDTAVIIAEAP